VNANLRVARSVARRRELSAAQFGGQWVTANSAPARNRRSQRVGLSFGLNCVSRWFQGQLIGGRWSHAKERIKLLGSGGRVRLAFQLNVPRAAQGVETDDAMSGSEGERVNVVRVARAREAQLRLP